MTLDHKRPHTSVIAMVKIHELRYQLLPYSPELTPSDFNLFPRLKIFIGGPRFSTTEELIAEGGEFCRHGGMSFSRWVQDIGKSLDQMH